jgi:hypothetical protein
MLFRFPGSAMRLLLLFAGLWFASIAGAAGLAGTYVLQGQNGPIVAEIEVTGAALVLIRGGKPWAFQPN